MRVQSESELGDDKPGARRAGFDLVITPRGGPAELKLWELWEYRELIGMFVRRDLATYYKQTILGPAWFIIQPLLTTIVFVIVFSGIAGLETGGVAPALFYLSGIVPWNYFADSFVQTSNTFVANQTIFSKVYFPRMVLPVSVVAGNLVKLLIQSFLFASLWLYHLPGGQIDPSASLLLAPPCILLLCLISLGFGVLSSGLTSKYRDLQFLIGFAVQLGMYGTPIIYPVSILSPTLRTVMWFNPLSHIIETLRHGFLGIGEVSWPGLCYSLGFAIGLLLLGLIVFNRTEQTFLDTV